MRVASIAALLLSVAVFTTVSTTLTIRAILDDEADYDDIAEDDGDGDGDPVISSSAQDPPPPVVTLVVGGTDGSGTRSVVSLLDRLGVPVRVDDPNTLDAHGAEMGKGGWPGTVRPVLAALGRIGRSADYEPGDLPEYIMDRALGRIARFWLSRRPAQRRTAAAAAAAGAGSVGAATDVTWAFKAPVSMLLVPLFLEVARQNGDGGVKFLHVIRDGRDIAYSDNQSPVIKFYNLTFPPDGSEGHSVGPSPGPNAAADMAAEIVKRGRAIKLWNAWNTQLLSWERRTVERQREGSSATGAAFDFLVLHVEDLVSSDLDVRRAAIASVAKFVGAPVSEVDVCCLATERTVSLGSHTKTLQSRSSTVESRYGKWQAKASPFMASVLSTLGSDGLRAFGYDQHDRPADQTFQSPSGICDSDTCRNWTAPRGLVVRGVMFRKRERNMRRMERKREIRARLRDRLDDNFGPRGERKGRAEERRRFVKEEFSSRMQRKRKDAV